MNHTVPSDTASPRASTSGSAAGPSDAIDRQALQEAVAAWVEQDPDPGTRSELGALVAAGDWPALASLFAGRLAFGTAGLRAEVGPGPLRMNRLMVRQAAAGLVAHLGHLVRSAPAADPDDGGRDRDRPVRLVVGYDARHTSPQFALDTAAVAAAAGVEVLLFDRPLPTPVLAFAVRHLAADGGVMVTASHNPPRDNGYKVYLGDGAQIVPPHDDAIATAIARAAEAPVPVVEDPSSCPLVTLVGDELVDAYLDAVLAQSVRPRAREVVVAYTPLCGVGAPVALEAFRRAGFPPPVVVPDQAEADPDFPGLPFPNPEEPGVLDRVLEVAAASDADVALANDPDADRLGVAVPDGAGWRPLDGNEIGALLADHLLRTTSGPERLVVSTVVSSRLVGRLAAAAGVHVATTLTGFKWIVRPAIDNPSWRFTFGYEEALGFLVGPAVRDKDGISAALLMAEVVADLRSRGSDVPTRLAELAREHGLHATAQWSLRFPDRATGQGAMAGLMARVRQAPPASLGGVALVAATDLAQGSADLPPSDVVIWDLEDGSRLVLRPSGTEPKLKVYAEVVLPVSPDGAGGHEATRRAADAQLAALAADLAPVLGVDAVG